MSNGFGTGYRPLGSGVLPISDDKPPTRETGAISLEAAIGLLSGLNSWSTIQSYDALETNPKLTFPESIFTYHNMRTDPQVQGLLTGATWPLMRMLWYIDPNGAPDEMVEHISADLNLPIGEDDAEPITNLDQISRTSQTSDSEDQQRNQNDPQSAARTYNRRRSRGRFDFLHHLETALDSIAYGFMVFEQVGYIGKDGLFHYSKLALRPPSTISEIILARDGGIIEVRQALANALPMPIGHIVVYSFQKRGANWHGRSMLRGCYAPWLLKDRAMRVGVMNIQRAGVGTPIAQGHPGASKQDLEYLADMMQRWVAGDRSGGAIPYGSKVELVGVTGNQPNAVEFIKLMNEEMSRSFFQMFMQLGQTTSGSRALGQTFVEYHKLVIEYIAQWFASTFNEHVIEDDIDWNWGPQEEYAPLLKWKWDSEGSDQNPQGPEAAQNPSRQLQKQMKDGKLDADEETQAVINNEIFIRP